MDLNAPSTAYLARLDMLIQVSCTLILLANSESFSWPGPGTSPYARSRVRASLEDSVGFVAQKPMARFRIAAE